MSRGYRRDVPHCSASLLKGRSQRKRPHGERSWWRRVETVHATRSETPLYSPFLFFSRCRVNAVHVLPPVHLTRSRSRQMNIVQNLLGAIAPLPDGDLADRLNYCYTTTLLVVCSAFISGWSFVGQPIQCWFPAYYRGWWIEYALDYCYVQNTYFLGFTDIKPDNFFDIAEHIIPIPKNHTEREEKQLGYYQWVPFILALQALLFYLPVVLWSVKSNMEPEERSKNMKVVAKFLIYDHEVASSLGGRIKSHVEGKLIFSAYLLVKLLYALNALFQFLIVKWLLGTDSIFWGLNVASDLMAGVEWPQTGNFPRVTMCDFSVRVLGNLHRHSVQCVLMINMFNEKIFVFLWFWYCILAIASFLKWLVASLNERAQVNMISKYLEKIDPHAARSMTRKSQIREFVQRTLRPDGLFLIQLISKNSGDLVTCELLSALWREYLDTERRPPPYDEPPLLSKKPLE